MLNSENNEILTRVGPGTASRWRTDPEFWMPALLRELPAPTPPARVRLLGEDLVAFRDSSGRVGH